MGPNKNFLSATRTLKKSPKVYPSKCYFCCWTEDFCNINYFSAKTTKKKTSTRKLTTTISNRYPTSRTIPMKKASTAKNQDDTDKIGILLIDPELVLKL